LLRVERIAGDDANDRVWHQQSSQRDRLERIGSLMARTKIAIDRASEQWNEW